MLKYLLYLLIVLLIPTRVLACSFDSTQPKTTLKERIEKSDAIIIGQRYPSGKILNLFNDYDYESGQPQTTKITVIDTLKGKVDKDVIVVRVSLGMCGHTFLYNNDEPVIMLMQNVSKASSIYGEEYSPTYTWNNYDGSSIYFSYPNSEDTEILNKKEKYFYDEDYKDYITFKQFITRYKLKSKLRKLD